MTHNIKNPSEFCYRVVEWSVRIERSVQHFRSTYEITRNSFR